jgi:hypothetical protein
MITYPKTKIDKRWDNMPEKLREILYSPAYGETLLQITDDYHLSEIKKEVVFKLVSFVIYGFIHKEELDKKIINEIDVDKKVVEELVEEIDKKIFSHIENELNDIYSPVSEIETTIETIKPKKVVSIETEKEDNKHINRDFIKSEFLTKEKKEEEMNTPFIIHKEGEKDKDKIEEKEDFSFSFNDFFDKKDKKENKSFAKINIPKKEPEKKVHYSEYRTPIDYKNKKSFINIPKQKNIIQKSEKDEQGSKIEKNKEKEKTPSVSGNVIDLSNLN